MRGLGFVRAPLIRFDKLVTSVTCLRAWQTDFGIITGGTPLASGTSLLAVTIAGQPTNIAFRLEIQTTGARGTATFRYSANGGATWIEQGALTAATYSAIGALIGTTITFPSGTYTNDNVYEGTCSSWTDSKNGTGAVQASVPKQPTIRVGVGGRLRLVSTNAAATALTESTLDLPAPATTNTFWWCVFRQTAWAVNQSVFGTPGGLMRLGDLTSTPNMACVNGVNGGLNSGASLGTLVRAEALFSGSTNDYLKIGTTIVSGASFGNSNPSASVTVCCFDSATTNRSLDGDVYAWLIFSGKPSASELAALSSAAAAMYPGVAV